MKSGLAIAILNKGEQMATTTPTSGVKSGLQTTEFILTVVSNIFTVFLSFKGILPANVAAIIVASITGLYTIARSIVKIYDPAYNAPDLPAGS